MIWKKKKQFDERYKLNPKYTDNPGVKKRSAIVEHQQKEALKRTSHRPSNIAWFEAVLAREQLTDDVPLIGYFCNMIPVEIIYALGAKPVRLGCGNAALVQPGEELLSGEICPLAKSSFAQFLDKHSVANKCKALVVPTSCDAKKKLGELLSDYKPVFMLNLPPEQDAGRYLDYAGKEMARLTEFLEEQTGRRLSTWKLRKIIKQTQKRAVLARKIQELRGAKPFSLSIRDMFIIVQASFSGADLGEWNRQVQMVITEIEGLKVERERIRQRLILTGAPIIWPNFKVLNLIEECGADVVADTVCSGVQSVYDPVVIDEWGKRGLMRALAMRYMFASPCPCFISQSTRMSRILELADEFKADGVLNYSLRLCQLFDLEAYRIAAVLKERKLAYINLRTDYSLEDTEQLRVRLEAFLETIDEMKIKRSV